MSAIPKAVRDAVKARERGMCLYCSSGRASEIHHRQRRREGGHWLSNVVYLCSEDHRRAHANPVWARSKGLIVPTHAQPLAVPVKSWRGWCFLDNDGALAFASGDIEHALSHVENQA